tara:strand:+ start:645 stop:2180 length:1536 start_codon:yes stop_codon:yes gene_type:complete
MAIRGFEKKDPYADFNQLLKLVEYSDAVSAKEERKIINKYSALTRQIDSANSIETLGNIKSSVENFNKEVKLAGYDEYSLESIFTTKNNKLSQSNIAFNQGRKYLDMTEGDQDEIYNEIMGMSWSESNAELNNLYSLYDSMKEGAEFDYNSDGKYTKTSIGKAIETRIGQIQNKLDVFAENEGQFLVYNPDGTMDESSLKIYKDLQFKILSGDVKDFDKYFDGIINDVSRKFQIQEKGYNDWLVIAQESKLGKTIDDMNLSEEDKALYKNIMLLNDEDSNEGVGLSFAKQMAENYRTNAVKYNRQHEVLTGSKYNDNPIYMSIDLEQPGDIPGTQIDDNASKVDSNSKKPKEDKTLLANEKYKKTVSYDEMTLRKEGDTNLRKEGNVWKVYDKESNSYKNVPKEYLEEISINGKIQEVPVIRGDRKIRKKDGSVSVRRGEITHIYVDGKWKKASVPEKKKKKPEETSRLSGTIKAPAFVPIYEEGEYEQLQKERNESYQWFWNKLLNQIKS